MTALGATSFLFSAATAASQGSNSGRYKHEINCSQLTCTVKMTSSDILHTTPYLSYPAYPVNASLAYTINSTLSPLPHQVISLVWNFESAKHSPQLQASRPVGHIIKTSKTANKNRGKNKQKGYKKLQIPGSQPRRRQYWPPWSYLGETSLARKIMRSKKEWIWGIARSRRDMRTFEFLCHNLIAGI